MSSFEQQFARPPPSKSRAGPSRPHVPVPVTSPALQSQQVQVSTAGPSSRPEKRRRFKEIGLANPPAVNPGSIMAVTKGAAREAMAEEAVLRMTEIAASQPGVLEGYTPDPELAEVEKRLPGYLQPVVTFMATIGSLGRGEQASGEEGMRGIGPRYQHGSLGECSFPSVFC